MCLLNNCCCCCWLDLGCIILAVMIVGIRAAWLAFIIYMGSSILDYFTSANKIKIVLITSTLLGIGCAIPALLVVGAICGCYQCVCAFVSMELLYYPLFWSWIFYLMSLKEDIFNLGLFGTLLKLFFLDFILTWLVYIILAVETVLELYLLWTAYSLYRALEIIYGPDSYD